MKPSVYIETTVISYLVSRPSRDLVTAANQQATREWWDTRRDRFELVVSDAVIEEISAGDPRAARQRLELAAGVRVITPGYAEQALALQLASALRLPSRAAVDALHVAIAAANGIQYLLTWNCAHIANAALRRRIESTCRQGGHAAPLICTPPELM